MTATVILDVDGTLVDSNDAHARAWVDACAAHGITAAFDTVRRSGDHSAAPGICWRGTTRPYSRGAPRRGAHEAT